MQRWWTAWWRNIRQRTWFPSDSAWAEIWSRNISARKMLSSLQTSSAESPSVRDTTRLCKFFNQFDSTRSFNRDLNHCRATQCLLKWQNFQRFYLYVLTENVKSIIMKHRNVLLSEDVKRRFGMNEREISAAATLPELDDAYTRKLYNFSSTTEMYKWSSCINVIMKA